MEETASNDIFCEFLLNHEKEQANKSVNNTLSKTKSSKLMIKHEKYNGKSDKVALYQLMSNEWNNNQFLSKNKAKSKSNFNTTLTQSSLNDLANLKKKENKENMFISQKVRNIRTPLSFYKKF